MNIERLHQFICYIAKGKTVYLSIQNGPDGFNHVRNIGKHIVFKDW